MSRTQATTDRVYRYLCLRAKNSALCTDTYRVIMRETGLSSLSEVKWHIDRLVAQGLVIKPAKLHHTILVQKKGNDHE